MKLQTATLAVIMGLSLSACTTERVVSNRVLTGAAVGGAAGAVVGGVTTGTYGGAVVGGAIGAAGGAIIADATAPKKQCYNRKSDGRRVCSSR
jgi:osmotically inducible lipoprotein OsmB